MFHLQKAFLSCGMIRNRQGWLFLDANIEESFIPAKEKSASINKFYIIHPQFAVG